MIGTGLALLGSAALGLGGSLLSGKMGADASKNAANAQSAAALGSLALQAQGLDFAKTQYKDARTDALPWMNAGKTALNQYQIEIGQKAGASKFRTTPGYAFQVAEGTKGVVNNLAALGMKNSGSALKSLTRFRMGLADQTYDTYLNRLGGLSGAGQTATSNVGSLGSQATNAVQQGLGSMGQSLQDAGAARASGYVGGANAWQNAIGSGVSNLSNTLGQYSSGNYPMAPSMGTTY